LFYYFKIYFSSFKKLFISDKLSFFFYFLFLFFFFLDPVYNFSFRFFHIFKPDRSFRSGFFRTFFSALISLIDIFRLMVLFIFRAFFNGLFFFFNFNIPLPHRFRRVKQSSRSLKRFRFNFKMFSFHGVRFKNIYC
jgi:hypothetical protein